MNTENLVVRMNALATEADPLRRKLLALGIVTAQLSSQGIVPILVGGSALAFYTAGGYATNDIDIILPISPLVDKAFVALGFQKENRFWVRQDLSLLFEAPAGTLAGDPNRNVQIEIDEFLVFILGVEDLLLDRLRAGVHWHSTEDERWAKRLAILYHDKIDWHYVREQTRGDEGEHNAVAELSQGAKNGDSI